MAEWVSTVSHFLSRFQAERHVYARCRGDRSGVARDCAHPEGAAIFRTRRNPSRHGVLPRERGIPPSPVESCACAGFCYLFRRGFRE